MADTDKTNSLFIALLALLIWLPLPLGSDRPWAWALAEVWGFGIMALWLYTIIRTSGKFPPLIHAARFPLIFMILWIAVTFFQVIPLPTMLLDILSPSSLELYSSKPPGMKVVWAPITIDTGATTTELFKGLLLFSVFILVLALVNTRSRLKTLAKVMVFVGLAEALYGLINTISGIERVWWIEKEYYRGFVTGTFINRNSFAGHMELVIPIGLGLLIADQPKLRHFANWRARVRGVAHHLLEGWGRLVVYVIIMMSALFLSGSRGGVTSFFAALLLTLLLALAYRGIYSREGRLFLFAVVMSFAAILWQGTGTLPERYNSIDYETLEGRSSVWEPALAMWGDYPLFGSGAGTFERLFVVYEERHLWKYYDHAHNDYLELLTDQGAIGFILMGCVVMYQRLFP